MGDLYWASHIYEETESLWLKQLYSINLGYARIDG